MVWVFGVVGISFGQFAPFESGYIINNQGDTIEGQLRYGTPMQRSSKVVFKAANDTLDEANSYKPFTIKSYFVKGETYDSKIYDPNPEQPNGYGAFMQRMNEGTVRVYYFWNTDKERGFTQTFLENSLGVLTEVQWFNFKKQMAFYFSDFPQLSMKILRGAFDRKDLIQIAQEYNKWKRDGW